MSAQTLLFCGDHNCVEILSLIPTSNITACDLWEDFMLSAGQEKQGLRP